MKRLVVSSLLLLLATIAWSEEAALDQCVADPAKATFRIFQTKNIWTFLKLDTRTGRVWQIQWGEKPAVVPITLETLQSGPVQPGRFTLCPTKNIFGFILLDQDDGRTWSLQWSFEEKNRGIAALPPRFVDPCPEAGNSPTCLDVSPTAKK